jgi:hypothetical protein
LLFIKNKAPSPWRAMGLKILKVKIKPRPPRGLAAAHSGTVEGSDFQSRGY